MTAHRVTGVVLAAGSSRRLGTPKQVLPYRDTTVLGATLDVARRAGFDQLIVTLGGAADAVRDAVPLDGAEVVVVSTISALAVRHRCASRYSTWTRTPPESC